MICWVDFWELFYQRNILVEPNNSHTACIRYVYFFSTLKILLFRGVYTRMYACHSVCRCLMKLEEDVRSGVRVTNVCEPPNVDAGN